MSPRRVWIIAIIGALSLSPSLARNACAQEPTTRLKLFPALTFEAAPPAHATFAPRNDQPAAVEPSRSSPLLRSLYVTTFVIQGLDAHSTFSAIQAGAVEKNPIMAPLTSHPAAFMAFKAGVATAMVLAGRRLARTSKLRAAIALIAINSAYAFIAAHNYRVAHQLR
jgi:hypothetical protein